MSLLNLVREAGVIGAGGAGFPTHTKLAAEAEYILMNGAECEPLLRVDQQLMSLYADEIIKGFEMAGRQVGASKAIIGIKEKHKSVVGVLRERIQTLNMSEYVHVHEMQDVYPAGDEQVLVYELTNRVVPEGGIPLHVGCVVVNSETALNIYYASLGLPVTEKYLTIAGDIPKRMTVKVPVGTPIRELFAMCGIENLDDYAVIDGGPMMGPVMTNLDEYVTKKSKGYIILKKTHQLVRKKTVTMEQASRVNKSTCEQCRMCTDMCPRYLLGHDVQPHKMMRTVNYGLREGNNCSISYLCCQCNLCELFSCPAGLFPKAATQQVKQKLVEQNIRYQTTNTSWKTRQNRPFRLLPSKRLIARLGLSALDNDAPFEDFEVQPKMVKIKMSQHVGAPCEIVVKVNDRVEVGQMIGSIRDGSLGAPIHASITGIVVECEDGFVTIRRD